MSVTIVPSWRISDSNDMNKVEGSRPCRHIMTCVGKLLMGKRLRGRGGRWARIKIRVTGGGGVEEDEAFDLFDAGTC